MRTRRTTGQNEAARERVLVEGELLALQTTIAALFCVAAASGALPTHHPQSDIAVITVALYHVAHAFYVLRRRIPGRPSALAEVLTPLFDVACITAAWVAVGNAGSTFWVVYLFALVGYTRRYHGRAYIALAIYIIANLALGRLLLQPRIDDALASALALAAAMALLAHAIGTAWRREEHQARLLAEIDPLTGITNRRAFLQRIDSWPRERGGAFAVLMLDLDDFKHLNDEHGHLYGDAVLVDVARALSDNVRAGDSVARYGGEEFIAWLPGSTLAQASALAERLRRVIAASTPTTISIGCAAAAPGEEPGNVVRRADDLLLLAKRTGKNTVRSDDSAARAA